MMIWNFSILIFLSASLLQDRHHRTTDEMHGLHRDPDAYIAMLESPERDAYQMPEEVIEALRLQPGQRVADIGSGSGYFSLRLAKAVGPGGVVYAVDIDPEMIRHLNRRVRDAGLDNVRTILADPNDPLLADSSVDRIFICNTWHHIEDRSAYLNLMKRVLRPNGKVVHVDFHMKELPFGPPLEMKIAREDLIRQMETAGFELAREETFLPYQYFLIFGVSEGE